jgi:hypothetical protein
MAEWKRGINADFPNQAADGDSSLFLGLSRILNEQGPAPEVADKPETFAR